MLWKMKTVELHSWTILIYCKIYGMYVKKYNYFLKPLAFVRGFVYNNPCCDIDSEEA